LLTAIAGWVDAIGFISLGGFYISFMSGNTTQLAIGLTRFDIELVRLPAVLLGCFVIGAFVGTLISVSMGRRSLAVFLLLEGLLLASAVLLSAIAGEVIGALAVAMGGQNAALRNNQGQRIGGTFVTGTLFGFGEQLALWALRRGGPRPALEHAVGWIALAVGAAAGTLVFASYRLLALAIPAGCALILAGVMALSNSGAGARMAADKRPDQLG
jgi:uncharacterized membrane protein YoaK (UPF0700 family)